jgi:hypothetical protein
MRKTNNTPVEYTVTVTGRDRDGYVTCETGSFVADSPRNAKDMALSFTSLMGASVEHCRKVDELANDYMGFMTVTPDFDDADDDVWSMF